MSFRVFDDAAGSAAAGVVDDGVSSYARALRAVFTA
jgi:hypothetical protein